MQKTFRVEMIPYDTKKKFFELPDKCLTAVVVNNGSSNIMVNDYAPVGPNQSFPFPVIPGYFLKQKIQIQIINDSSKALETKVRIRLAIEND